MKSVKWELLVSYREVWGNRGSFIMHYLPSFLSVFLLQNVTLQRRNAACHFQHFWSPPVCLLSPPSPSPTHAASCPIAFQMFPSPSGQSLHFSIIDCCAHFLFYVQWKHIVVCTYLCLGFCFFIYFIVTRLLFGPGVSTATGSLFSFLSILFYRAERKAV